MLLVSIVFIILIGVSTLFEFNLLFSFITQDDISVEHKLLPGTAHTLHCFGFLEPSEGSSSDLHK